MLEEKENIEQKETPVEELSSTQESNEEKEQAKDSPEQAATEVILELEHQITELKDKYLRLYAEFDNFKKRTAKERIELMNTAGKEIIVDMLSVLDDFDRAMDSMNKAEDIVAVKEGVSLVYNKLSNKLKSKGVKPMQTKGEDFDAELHEAITEIPAPSEDMKGKVIDEIEKGYFLNEKIIRFAKVVVGK